MDAPWVEDRRYFAQRDDEDAADLARERVALEIISDHQQLAAALANRDENDRWLVQLARVLSEIYSSGTQATSMQTLMLNVAVQAISDDAAKHAI